MNAKKAAVMIYPYFSLQEISALTSCLAIWHEREMDVFASSKAVMKSEEGFQVTANKTFEAFDAAAYDCLILPGMINPLPALFDEGNIAFLRGLKGKDILIASISSAPMLLAKAGLLDNRKFTCGIWDEIIKHCDFIPERNVLHTPVCRDENIITAIGFAFREFAVEVMRAIGIACKDDILMGVSKEYTEEELTFKMGEESFQAFLSEYNAYKEGYKAVPPA